MSINLPTKIVGWLALYIFASLIILSGIATAETTTIGGRPANPRDDNPRTKSIFVYELEPGQITSDAVEVFNNTSEQKEVKIYATDAVVSSGGAFACAQEVEEVKETGAWINISQDSVKLAPGTSQKVPFTVVVPKSAEPGEANACIAIQEANAAPAQVGNGIALNFRSAIRVAITVPGEINKQLEIKSVTLKDNGDKLIGTIILENKGNVSLDTDIVATLERITGFDLQKIEGTYPSLPGTNTELNFEYNKPYWGGLVRLSTTASYNDDLASTLGEGSANKTVSGSSGLLFVWPKPLAMAVIIATLVALYLGARYLYKRYYVLPKQAKRYHDYTVKKSDDIQSIAKANGIGWKHLAIVNNIKAPYALEPGTVIKVPNMLDTNNTKQKPEPEAKPSTIQKDAKEKKANAETAVTAKPKKSSKKKVTKKTTKPKTTKTKTTTKKTKPKAKPKAKKT